MATKAIQEWLDNPLLSLTRPEQQALLAAVKSEAVRRMATEHHAHSIDDKQWKEMSLLPEWQKLQNSRHMGVELAARRDAHIFDILSKGSLQRAKDYMAATIKKRLKNELGSSRRKK